MITRLVDLWKLVSQMNICVGNTAGALILRHIRSTDKHKLPISIHKIGFFLKI